MEKIINIELSSTNFKTYAIDKICKIFDSMKKSSVFKEMLEKNFVWLSQNLNLLKDIFFMS